MNQLNIIPEEDIKRQSIIKAMDGAESDCSQLNQQRRISTLIDSPIRLIADLVHANAIKKGFHPPGQDDGTFLAHQLNNMHAECSELYDAWRNGVFHAPCDKAELMSAAGLPFLTSAEEEYADIIIRAMDQCRHLGIDIARAIAIKHLFNLTRPYRHGNRLS